MAREIADGGCACGAIRYRVEGRPLVSSVCHCRTCRKTAGAPLVPWEIDVTACSLDDPDAFPPSHHAWGDHRVKWLRLDDGLPVHAGREPRS